MSWQNRIIGYDTKPAHQFTANPLNWRTHPNVQREALRGLLGEVGWVGAVLENKRTGNLIDGHARIEEALSKDENAPIPYLLVDLSEEEERLVLASFDPISALANSDKERLELLLKDLSSSSDAVDSLLRDVAKKNGVVLDSDPKDAEPQIDKDEELKQKWGTETGQLWGIGNHRLFVGDSTNQSDVQGLLTGQKFDILVTSPPYTDQREYKIGAFEWLPLMTGVWDVALSLAAPNAHLLVNLGMSHKNRAVDHYWNGWLEHSAASGWPLFGWYVWDKGFGLCGEWNGRLAPAHEFVFHFNNVQGSLNKWQRSKTVGRSGDAAKHRFRQPDGTLHAATSPDKIGQPFRIPDSVIRITKETNNQTNHPAPFPPELPAFMLQTWSDEGDICYEPFCGSGSSLVAAENLNRKCYAIEISPAYVAVCLERMSTAFPHLKIEKVQEAHGKAA